MADVKISALPAASSAASTDELPANQSGTTRKLTVQKISDFVSAASGGNSKTGANIFLASNFGGF